jgi:hypothetical protein
MVAFNKSMAEKENVKQVMCELGHLMRMVAIDRGLKTVYIRSREEKDKWPLAAEILRFYSEEETVFDVTPLDRLMALLAEVAICKESVQDTVKLYGRKNKKDSEVVERLRRLQASFLIGNDGAPFVTFARLSENVRQAQEEKWAREKGPTVPGKISTTKSDKIGSGFKDENSQSK